MRDDTSESNPAVALQAITKRYGSKTVLSGVSFRVCDGITGVVGPNGAGKSTLLDICAGFLKPTSGDIHWGTETSKEVSIGYLPQRFTLPRSATPRQVIEYALWSRGWPARDRKSKTLGVLERAHLEEHADTSIGKLSGGTSHRVAFKVATAHDPRLIVLDEPTTGLDVEQRALVRTLMAEQRTQRSVLISSHIAEDIETLCTQLVALRAGSLRFFGTLEDFAPTFGSSTLEDALIAAAQGDS